MMELAVPVKKIPAAIKYLSTLKSRTNSWLMLERLKDCSRANQYCFDCQYERECRKLYDEHLFKRTEGVQHVY